MRYLVAFTLLAVWLGLSGAALTDDYPVLGHLVTRDYKITISGGPQGALYSLTRKDGVVIASHISEVQLSEQYPHVFHKVRSGVAGSETVIEWAGM